MAKISTKELFSKSVILGTGADKIILDNSQVFSLINIAISDLGWHISDFCEETLKTSIPSDNFYEIPFEWFLNQTDIETDKLVDLLETIIQKDSDFSLFFSNICALHKRRIKYQNILSQQPRPTMEQIGPRGLLEYGLNSTKLLSNWMIWRKWIFDIDNRSGQETGYLFEPILASCLGGISISSSKSPVNRVDDDGNPTKGGRQIDCYVANENVAYEFKLRVTIAASGQGRFSEELSFPKECSFARIKPVLLVLDATPSDRLTELINAFHAVGGESYIGEDAWKHMDDKAGDIISVFIDKYIKTPLLAIANEENHTLSKMQLSWLEDSIIISDGQEEYKIIRD